MLAPSGVPVAIQGNLHNRNTLENHWKAIGKPLEDHWKQTGISPVAFQCTLGSKFQAHWIATGLPLEDHWLRVRVQLLLDDFWSGRLLTIYPCPNMSTKANDITCHTVGRFAPKASSKWMNDSKFRLTKGQSGLLNTFKNRRRICCFISATISVFVEYRHIPSLCQADNLFFDRMMPFHISRYYHTIWLNQIIWAGIAYHNERNVPTTNNLRPNDPHCSVYFVIVDQKWTFIIKKNNCIENRKPGWYLMIKYLWYVISKYLFYKHILNSKQNGYIHYLTVILW